MQISDSFQPKGELRFRVVDINGKVIYEYKGENLVVNTGKLNMAKLHSGDVAGLPADTIGVGTSATAANVTDTTLTGSFTRALNGNTSYGTVTYPANGHAMYAFTILTGEANGMSISEFGLLNGNGDLIARKVIATPISKTVSFAIEGEWIIKFL